MDDDEATRLGAPDEFRPFEDLGRWMRHRETAEALRERLGDRDESAYVPLSEDRVDALIDRVLEARPGARRAEPTSVSTSEAAPRRAWGRPLSVVSALAAAVVAAFVISRQGSFASSSAAPPRFASMRIDGGGPPPAHQGASPSPEAQLLCQDRPMRLVLATPLGSSIDTNAPLELTLEATPPAGSGHRFAFDVRRDERWQWVDGGRALLFAGTLEQLAPLTPGRWTLQVSAGAPGACSVRGGLGCSSLEVRTIEVIAKGSCDAPP